jgi:dihydrofolate synthase/folylpolyglutamate synthase
MLKAGIHLSTRRHSGRGSTTHGEFIISTETARDAAQKFLAARVDYERALSIPYQTHGFKLDRMRELLRRLGDPQDRLAIVHVAGTKGKGSTTAMIGAVLGAAGYRTGLFTSPHLEQIEERITVDGQLCPPEELTRLLLEIRPVVEQLDAESTANDAGRATYFEIVTAVALLYFVAQRVDVAVLEVGLGGRLDSTNVCRPLVSVITSISFDHTRQLGDTLAAIAWEKAGIVKPGRPVVSGVLAEEPRAVVRQVCRKSGSPLAELGREFSFDYTPPPHLERGPEAGRLTFHYHGPTVHYDYADLALGLLGRHQAANAAVAIAAIQELRLQGFTIDEPAIARGLAELRWPARIELLGWRPAIVVDAAHNVASVEALVRSLQESFQVARRRLLFATTREKDLSGMLACLLPAFDEVVFTQYATNPRAVPAEEAAAAARAIGGQAYWVQRDPVEAWHELRARSAPDDLLCVTGSFFLAAEIRRMLAPPQGARS